MTGDFTFGHFSLTDHLRERLDKEFSRAWRQFKLIWNFGEIFV